MMKKIYLSPMCECLYFNSTGDVCRATLYNAPEHPNEGWQGFEYSTGTHVE